MGKPSSTASSPPAGMYVSGTSSSAKDYVCFQCKKNKKGCDKKRPSCGTCLQHGRDCQYADPGVRPATGLYQPVAQATDVNTIAFRTLMDIFHQRQPVLDALKLYFDGVHTWFPVVDQSLLMQELEDSWGNLPAETSVLILCMTLLTHPPAPRSKGMENAEYRAVKGILGTVRGAVAFSIPLLQSQLLLAFYEFSHNMPRQAYFSVGDCVLMTKALGWHDQTFWHADDVMAVTINAKELQRCSILWWALVDIDCLLKVGYPDLGLPMHTLTLQVPPLPSTYDVYLAPFGGQDLTGTGTFPEARSAYSLSVALQHLSNPAADIEGTKAISDEILRLAKPDGRNGAGAIIALLKLWPRALLYPSHNWVLHSTAWPPNTTLQAHHEASTILANCLDWVTLKAQEILDWPDQLDRGAVDPCWGLAIYLAMQHLLVMRGGDDQPHQQHHQQQLRAANPLNNSRTMVMRAALDVFARRWKIGERCRASIQVVMDSAARPASAPSTTAISRPASLGFAPPPHPPPSLAATTTTFLATTNPYVGRRTSA